MREDNTPTVTKKTRKKTSHMRLRLDIMTRLKKLEKGKGYGGDGKKGSKAKDATAVKPVNSTHVTKVVTREARVKKNTLQKPPKPKARFRKRQIHKTWLPTHLFHAKRAHMTSPKEPLWRMAIALSPTVKSYRPTHRARTLRGGMAWDMSYISTIGLEGPEKSVIGLLKALSVGKSEPNGFWDGKGAARWLNGSRAWEGWVYERDSWPTKAIAPITIFWCANRKPEDDGAMAIDQRSESNKEKRRVFIRVHPAAFLQLWEEILRLSKVQKPAVVLEDLRYEIGSIEVVGPGSTEALVSVLHPAISSHENGASKDAIKEHWHILGDVTNPASLPQNALLAMNVSDPRLRHPLKPRVSTLGLEAEKQEQLLQILSSWPQDNCPVMAQIFDRSARTAASHHLPSQKAINRRRTLAKLGQYPDPAPNDPKIPALLLASRGPKGTQGKWTVLLPWKCILPVWSSLLYYPLSTGGTLRFGGLDQKRQMAFETGTPWFPADYPATTAGMAWEISERVRRKKEWEKRPKGKRIEFDSLKLGPDRKGEVGLGWACDWEHLIKDNLEPETPNTENVMYQIPSANLLPTNPTTASDDVRTLRSNALVAVKITLIGRGVPIQCARVYRLPMDDHELREKWLSMLTIKVQKSSKPSRASVVPKDAPPHIVQRHLAATLLEPPDILQSGDPAYPNVPSEQHLIGFVTTGNFNLGEGKGTGIGSIMLSKVVEYKAWNEVNAAGKDGKSVPGTRDEHLCIVREAGQVLGRLAKWEVV